MIDCSGTLNIIHGLINVFLTHSPLENVGSQEKSLLINQPMIDQKGQ